MKYILILILSLSCLNSYSQTTIYVNLRNAVKRDWIRPNPILSKPISSFFKKGDFQKYIIAPIEISGFSKPFTWDCDLSILKFLTNIDSRYKILKGKNADEIYLGTKFKWDKPISALIWINHQIYESQVDNWSLFEKTDCPGTRIFPSLDFKKIFELKNPILNNLSGIVIIPFAKNITYVHEYPINIKTVDLKVVKGIAYDINKDNVPDVFIYYENLNKEGTKVYTRLYINIEGEWICKWIYLDEVCV